MVGRATALEMTLEGRVYDASEAVQKGLVHQGRARRRRWKRRSWLPRGASPRARRWPRAGTARRSAGIDDPAPLTEAEIEGSYAYADSEDYHIGYRAFLDKEKAQFRGR